MARFGQRAGRGVPVRRPEGSEEQEQGEPAVQAGSGAGLSAQTVRAAENLDVVIDTLVKNFGEGSDYFKVLVSVFQSVLLDKDHDHLKTFHLLVPALCISWTDASLVAKDAMYKTARGVTKEMYFTDDGFAVGVAYCLAILKQQRRCDSLHWIETVNAKIKADSKDLKVCRKKLLCSSQFSMSFLSLTRTTFSSSWCAQLVNSDPTPPPGDAGQAGREGSRGQGEGEE